MHSKRPSDPLAWLSIMAHEKIRTETVARKFYLNNDIHWDILRTDLLHPICSGNKFFKLKYYMLDAVQKNHTSIVTAGGAWSNHIVATAYAAKACNLQSTGIIRGEQSSSPSDTLLEAARLGMKLTFLSRAEYPAADQYADSYFIPAGGYGEKGAFGAGEMLDHAATNAYTHIIAAVGTGTMLAGLANKAPDKNIIGIPVLKHEQIGQDIAALSTHNITLMHQFTQGGYAKKNPALLHFMNRFYEATGIPTDFVYTGKLMLAVDQLIREQYFAAGSRVLVIHSGGLQGNKSLKKGALVF